MPSLGRLNVIVLSLLWCVVVQAQTRLKAGISGVKVRRASGVMVDVSSKSWLTRRVQVEESPRKFNLRGMESLTSLEKKDSLNVMVIRFTSENLLQSQRRCFFFTSRKTIHLPKKTQNTTKHQHTHTLLETFLIHFWCRPPDSLCPSCWRC